MLRPRFLLVLALGTLASATLAPAVFGDDWPQFRGPRRDGISAEKGLLRSWPAEGPKVLWSTEMGQGYSAAAIVGGVVYFNDYDEPASKWLVRAVRLADGKELWRFEEERRIRPNHGITRTVPAVDGQLVFSLDPKNTLHALDAKTGSEVWRKNLLEEYQAAIPPWYNGQCPLIESDRVIVGTGGAALLVAFAKADGKELWRTPNPEGFLMSHSSPMPANIGGVPQLLYSVLQGTFGIDAKTGQVLWHYPFKFNVSVSPSPLQVDAQNVFLTAGYDAGSAMIKVTKNGAAFTAEEVFTYGSDVWNSEIQTPIVWKDHLFAVGKTRRGLFTCLDKKGQAVWTSDGQASFDLGNYILADGMFFILDGRTGMLHLVEASTEAYKPLASAQVLAGHDVWGPIALSDGKLVVRDLTKMVALQVK